MGKKMDSKLVSLKQEYEAKYLRKQYPGITLARLRSLIKAWGLRSRRKIHESLKAEGFERVIKSKAIKKGL